MGESNLAELGAGLSEAKQQVLRKYLQGDATPAATQTIKSRQRAALSVFEEIPLDRPIQLLFEDQVKRSPDACAAVFENEQLTYATLNRQANQLAHHLQELGVGPETLVGLAVERSMSMLIAALAILKAGGAYVPLDPALPRERLRFMIEDAQLAYFVTQDGIIEEAAHPDAIFVKLQSDRDAIARENDENPTAPASAENLAYVIYTSGSTGQPKGVQITHGALTNFLCSMHREPGLTAKDTLLSVTTLSFDIAGLELYLPLICGARVVIAGHETAGDGRLLRNLIATSGATVMQATPATWRMLIEAGWQGSERLKALCGGEALSRNLANDLLARTEVLWNMYGPTETTIWSSISKVENNTDPITVGRAIANTQFYVLNQNLNPVRPGESGELYIGGLGLARGYLNRPELTAEKFAVDPFADSSGARIYKTGDIVRLLPDGTAEFVGRTDNQVKLRGFRIELGEIEAALAEAEGLAQAAVVLREDEPGDKRLVAYVVAKDGAPLNVNDLRAHLDEKLPEYMLPAAIIELPQLPLTPNAKIDRKALPAPDSKRSDLTAAFVGPRNHIEAAIARKWVEVLKLEPIGIHDNFFELGGNSLLAGSMLSRIRDEFSVDLPIRRVFESPTVAGLAREISRPTKDLAAPKTFRARAATTSQLSFPQERLWFLDQLNPGSAVFNIPLAARLSTALDVPALKRSIAEIIHRHEVLRTTFVMTDSQPAPIVSARVDIDLPVIDLSHLPGSEREARARELTNDETLHSFDLTTGPVIRTTLLRMAERDYIFLVTMHHIASDGWSMVLFMNELAQFYEAFKGGAQSLPAELPIQYADYAAWQRQRLSGEMLERQLAYWKQQLGGELPVLDLPTDRPRPAIQTFNGARKWLVLSETQTEAIKALCRREGGTLFMTLLAAFYTLLHRYTGQEDIIIGSPIGARPLTETEKLIGFFLNNLALRTDLSGDPTFREILDRVRQTALEAFANQDVPFEKLIEELRPERDLSRTPLFQVYFNLLNFVDEIRLPGTNQTTPFIESWAQSEENFSKFDLTFYAGIHERRLKLAMVYNVDLFGEDFIAQMLGNFETLLSAIVANPAKGISNFPLRNEIQQQSGTDTIRPANAFVEFNRSDIEQSITNRFEEQVKKYPANIAVKSMTHGWSYQELNERANRIARSVLAASGAAEERVALLFAHDAPMIAGMLGVLKAGKTYVPLDPSYPVERLSQLLDDSQATTLLTNEENLELARKLTGVRVLNVDTLDSSIPSGDLNLKIAPSSLAYILYTSGSTGRPKGVMQNHRNVLHFIRAYTNNLHVDAGDRLTLLSSYCFDAAVMDIYGALLNGATLYPLDIKEDGFGGLCETLSEQGITIYHSTPTVYRYFISEMQGRNPTVREGAKNRNSACAFPNRPHPSRAARPGTPGRASAVRLVVLGGEEVTPADVELYKNNFADDCLLINGLGPTESTVSLQYFIDKQTAISGTRVPVGYPVDDTEVFLISRAGKPTEMYGEIAIKSEHVALGYWRNAETTAAAFSRNGSSARTYRTGDMGRRLADGSIVFTGRKDLQVKIRGVRVEPGEVESALANLPGVRECVVVAAANGSNDRQLVAYVVPRHGESLVTSDLRSCLQEKLPDYMVPSAFVVLDELPLTSSGKLNRRGLPAPEISDRNAELTGAAPRTPTEKLLAEIWRDVLGVSRIGIHEDFFDLGGHSLLAVRLFAQIEKRFGRRWPLATLFQFPTVAQFAATIEKDWSPKWSSLVAIKPDGSKPPFFCVHGLGGNVLEFSDLARHLDDEQPFYGLQSQGLDGKQPLLSSVEDMAAHYVKEMRELQPVGPYFIGGRSLGGAIAFEMARQFRAEGQEIAVLALLDTYPAQPARLVRRLAGHATNLRGLSFSQKLGYVAHKARFAPRKIKGRVWRTIYDSVQKFGRTLPRVLESATEFNSLAAHRYQPQAYDGRVTLFWARDDLRASNDLVAGWRALAIGGIEVQEIPGDHLNIIKEPHVAELADKLMECLRRAQNNSGAVARP
jgi:amino acid adenylation domain-containing protein